MSMLLKISGTVVLINGICVCFITNINLGNFLTVGLGAFFLVWGMFFKKINEITRKGVYKVLKICVIILLCFELALVGFVALYGQADNVDYNEDVLIVLGAGLRGEQVTLPLKMRLDKAVLYYEKNPEVKIIVTGGQGPQETVTEASAMAKYLAGKGVAEDKIILEEAATSTNENMRFSKKIADEYFDGEFSAAVITNNFHIYRSVKIAKNEGLGNVTHLHCGLQWYNLIPCYLRESLAVLKMWVFD